MFNAARLDTVFPAQVTGKVIIRRGFTASRNYFDEDDRYYLVDSIERKKVASCLK